MHTDNESQVPGTNVWRGRWVKLAARNVETDAVLDVRWERDSSARRMSSPDPTFPISLSQAQEYYAPRGPRSFSFAIHTVDDDRTIGYIGLWIESWSSREAWVGVAIGDRADWGRGYGTEAMQLVLRYAFTELDLFRVSLDVLGSNARAIRSYEKCGFVREGEVRQAARYDGQYFSEVAMGILKDEWFKHTSDG